MQFKDLYPNLAFKDEWEGNLDIRNAHLTSLEGCPKIIHGDFDCSWNAIESLIGDPERVEGSYRCQNNKIESLDGIASYIGDILSLSFNPIESITGIHKKITYLGGSYIWLPKSCKRGLLDIFKMNAPNLTEIGIDGVYFDNEELNFLRLTINKYLISVNSGELTKSQAMLQCQSELIENDLDEYTEY